MKNITLANGTEMDLGCLSGMLDKYKDMFIGKQFKDATHLSRALMFAKCATEAYLYGNYMNLTINENAMKSELENCL